eukprot:CAMPEP_0198362754 /NCGR_PEP_ID=MMETSP1450-20131203/147359_1 /TAXON_ID=753684 ORGANISM="Madagascaria erythrocladiodes, Strain CCMP3234" /NCGR_SAMPLE_ID=MMETSP1450 /ASSEMBLY_ACC=CAM_ASM_001115 /LENGTH=73 /DNA_ID=CAMNT_0044070015 /DNA_START=44 /DNA_END=265 /DNA_ORIENTATION=+
MSPPPYCDGVRREEASRFWAKDGKSDASLFQTLALPSASGTAGVLPVVLELGEPPSVWGVAASCAVGTAKTVA